MRPMLILALTSVFVGILAGLYAPRASEATVFSFTLRVHPGAGFNLNWIQVALAVALVPSDLDRDGDVDQTDFGIFQACYTAAPGSIQTGCEGADFDGTTTIDYLDFNQFQACMAGPNQPAACQ